MKKVIKQAFLSTLPVMAGYIVLGFGLGIILKTNGHSILLAFAIMGMLVVYCLKGNSFDSLGGFMPAYSHRRGGRASRVAKDHAAQHRLGHRDIYAARSARFLIFRRKNHLIFPHI